jgi:hypothetical protein
MVSRSSRVITLQPYNPRIVAVTVHPDEEPITGSGWFSLGELRDVAETVYPDGLAQHLERLLHDGVPATALHLGDTVED